MMTVTFMGVDELIRGLTSMAEVTPETINLTLREGAELTQEIMQSEAPRSPGGGEFASSINYDIDGSMAEIGPDDSVYGGRNVAQAIEMGRPPGAAPPPYTALMARYGLSIAEAMKAAKTISERGIQPNPFTWRTYLQIKDIFETMGTEAIYKIVSRF